MPDPDVKMDHVPHYHGDPAKLERFLMLLGFYFEAAPITFASDRSKIRYTASRLDGRAANWIEPLYTSNDRCLDGTFTDFITVFRAQFSDRQAAAKAASTLLRLKQRKNQPVHEFSNEFKALLHQAKWSMNDAASLDLFWMALDDSIVNGILTGGDPLTLEECIQKAIEYDHRALARRRHLQPQVAPFRKQPSFGKPNNRPAVPAQPVFPPGPRVRDDGGTRPMELDGVSIPRPKLTDQEKEYRRTNGLCLYCGGPGHIALNCPRTPKVARVNGVSAEDTVKDITGSGKE